MGSLRSLAVRHVNCLLNFEKHGKRTKACPDRCCFIFPCRRASTWLGLHLCRKLSFALLRKKDDEQRTNITKSKPRPCMIMIPIILDNTSSFGCQNASPFAHLLLPSLARPSFDRTFQHNLLQTSHFLRFFLIIPNPFFQADAGLWFQLGSYKEWLDQSKDTRITRFSSLQSTCSVSIQKQSKRFSNCKRNLYFQALFIPPLINMFPSMLVYNEKQDLDRTFSGV